MSHNLLKLLNEWFKSLNVWSWIRRDCRSRLLPLSAGAPVLAPCRLVDGTYRSWTEGILLNEHYTHQDLIAFFGYQLKVKNITDIKQLASVNFDKRWVRVASLVRVNRTNFPVFSLLKLQRGGFLAGSIPD